MAKLEHTKPENTQGEFFVDSSCIDCDACRWMAPEIFSRNGNGSIVYHQPDSDYLRQKALEAMIACPTHSIGATQKERKLRETIRSFPIQIEDNVYHTGFHSPKSYGATSYFIKRPEGNILIDSPRFDLILAHKLDELGGIKYLYFTHNDPVADHEKYHDYFNCDRIIHKEDVREDLKDFEIQLEGMNPIRLADDILVIPSPGHTKGLSVMLYGNKFLFTGDHLAFSPTYNQLIGFQDFCWHSWDEQIKSMEKLQDYDFEWILPGHGRRFHSEPRHMSDEIKRCIDWMQTTQINKKSTYLHS